MSGKLIDDYLSELMDDPGGERLAPAPTLPNAPTRAPPHTANGNLETDVDTPPPAMVVEPVVPAEAAEGSRSNSIVAPEIEPDDSGVAATPEASIEAVSAAVQANAEVDPLAAFRDGPKNIDDSEFERMLDALGGKTTPSASTPAVPVADPLAAFRGGPKTIDDSEFDRMLDALEGKTAAAPLPATPVGDPLAAFRGGPTTIDESEFEAMLDAMQGAPALPPTPVARPIPPPSAAPAKPVAPVRAPQPASPSAGVATAASPTQVKIPESALRAIEKLLSGSKRLTHPDLSAHPERARRADDTITSWLRFNVGRQLFAVEVIKVQEVLRVPFILPVRGTDRAMLGVMNLRGQIVPVMDLGLRLGFEQVESTDSSRVIVLEERGDTLGMLVNSVSDVANLSDGRIERVGGGVPSTVAAEVVRGIARREGNIIILLDGSRLLA